MTAGNMVVLRRKKPVVHCWLTVNDGHADPRGSDQYNQDLSEARAASVGQVLQEVGASPMTIQTEGRGEQEALADGQNRFYALDRRVDIQLSFDGKPVNEGLYSVR